MIVIPGPPVPQGSKRAFAYTPKTGGKPRASVVDDNPTSLKAWRSLALGIIRDRHPAGSGVLFDKGTPVALRVRFVFPLRVEDRATIKRYDKGDPVCGPQADIAGVRGAPSWGPCSPGCPHLPWHTVKPDKDKTTRALFDVLKLAGVWHDDAQCCRFDVLAYRSAEPCTMVEWVALA